MGQRFKRALINYAKNAQDVQTPDFDGYAVTPTNATVLPNGQTRAIYVTGTGNVAGTMDDGVTTFVLTGVPAGSLLEISASIIAATGTTATGIFALY